MVDNVSASKYIVSRQTFNKLKDTYDEYKSVITALNNLSKYLLDNKIITEETAQVFKKFQGVINLFPNPGEDESLELILGIIYYHANPLKNGTVNDYISKVSEYDDIIDVESARQLCKIYYDTDCQAIDNDSQKKSSIDLFSYYNDTITGIKALSTFL